MTKILGLVLAIIIAINTFSSQFIINAAGLESNRMIHITATGNSANVFQKTAILQKGKTYTATFKYNVVSGELNNSFYFMVNKAQSVVDSSASDKGKIYFDGRKTEQFVSIEESEEGSRTLSYTFTLQDRTGLTISDGSVKVDLGFYIEKKQSEFYFADFTVYETDDKTKTNLLLYPDDSIGLYGWHTDYKMVDSETNEFTHRAYTAKCILKDEKLFEIPKYMLNVVNNGNKFQILTQCVELEKGKTYTVKYKYKYATGFMDYSTYFVVSSAPSYIAGKSSKVYFDSHLENAKKFDSVSYNNDISEVTYTFTLTDKYNEDGSVIYELAAGKQKYSVGFAFENAYTGHITDLYVADMVLFESNDESKTNLLPVTDYSEGMYGWGCEWVGAEKGDESFTHSSCDYVATYKEYDESIFKFSGYGDANKDTKINIADLVKLKNLIVNSDYSITADVTKDSILDAEDTVTFIKHLLGAQEIESLVYPKVEKIGGAGKEANEIKEKVETVTDSVSSKLFSTYYVDSQNGKDSNTGKSQYSPLKTLDALSEKTLKSGDVVLFKRGSVFRTDKRIKLVSGVSYGAYGNGAKPVFMGSLKNYAESVWIDVGNGVWKLENSLGGEAGVVTFDGDTAMGYRRESIAELYRNGDYFHDYKDTGDFYLKLDGKNPSDYFKNIEIGASDYAFYGIYPDSNNSYQRKDITVNNISMKYYGSSGIDLAYCSNINITGCEFRFIGGNWAANGRTRAGNAITIWEVCDGVTVDRCLFNEIFDTPFTFQGQREDPKYKNISVTNCLIEYTSMNFEFWGDTNGSNSTISNINFSNNAVRFGGFGFGGIQRKYKTDQGVILGWEHKYDENDIITDFVISNNIFDWSDCYIFRFSETVPISFSTNKYYQGASSFLVNRNSDIKAVDQASLEEAIVTVDKNPALVQWLD